MKSIKIFSIIFIIGANFISFADSLSTEEQNATSEFNFRHKLSRLYSIHTAEIMNSLDFSLSLGGAFGFEENGFLGTLAFGLGGFGDIEVTSSSLMGSIFGREEYFGNIGLKIKILNNSESPYKLAAGIRTNNAWNSSRTYEDDIQAVSQPSYEEGLRRVEYDSRSTNLYIALATSFKDVHTIHIGLGLTDLRFKNSLVQYKINEYFVKQGEQRKDLFNYFLGYELYVNPRTKFLVEINTLPIMDVNVNNGILTPKLQVGGIVGIRFFVTRWLVLDTGINYQENYSGIADAQIKLGLNGIWSIPQ